MKTRRPLIVLLLGIAFLLVAHVAVRSYEGGRRSERRRTLCTLQSEVCEIKIERPGASVLALQKDENQRWHLVEPFRAWADQPSVERLVDLLVQTPIIDFVSDAELLRLGRRHADFSLVDPIVRVTLETGKLSETVSFGIFTPSSDGVYASVDGLSAVFVVPAEILSSVDHPMEFFRCRSIFSEAVEQISSFVVRQGKAPGMSFEREGDGWKVDGELASKTRVEGFLADLLSTESIDFVWPVGATNETQRISAALLAGYGLDPENAVTVTLKGIDDKTHQLAFGRAAESGSVYASVQNGLSVVTVNESLKSAALQTKAAFSDFRLFPVSESSVSFIRLVDGGSSTVLAKDSDGSWRMESPVSAPADPNHVHELLLRILALSTGATQKETAAFAVALSTDAEPVLVSRSRVLGTMRIDDLRSTEMIRIEPKEVKRLVCTPSEKGAPFVSIVRGREEGIWLPETAVDHHTIPSEMVENILSTLNPLVALRVEKLKVLAADLDTYGLGNPALILAIDFDREDAVRRNILIGGKTDGGYFATIGAADAVFVISTETVNQLKSVLIRK